MYEEVIIRTQYDGKDLMSVVEIFSYDDDGEELICEAATNACIGITTCADQGTDLWSWLKGQVELRLKELGISYNSLSFESDNAM